MFTNRLFVNILSVDFWFWTCKVTSENSWWRSFCNKSSRNFWLSSSRVSRFRNLSCATNFCWSYIPSTLFLWKPYRYLRDGFATTKSDVYAFGVVLFELISGKEATTRTEGTTMTNNERRSLASIVSYQSWQWHLKHNILFS